ncbi:MAG: hypothetical protein ACOYD1_07715 [Candidatus Nanopelagicales bacterium]
MTNPLQTRRHSIRKDLGSALASLEGRQGIAKEAQIDYLNRALRATNSAQAALLEAVAFATERDFDAYHAEKSISAVAYDDDDAAAAEVVIPDL